VAEPGPAWWPADIFDDEALARELLGWWPVTSFAEGVRRYLDWLGEGT